ncbi:MAG: hypothetical protein EXR79_17500 [Myxococcales bacterium]|nr:hypothetical protein [Myxococcales bacterium]
MATTAARLHEPPHRLVRQAAGPVRVWPGKVGRFGASIAAYAGGARIDARLASLHAKGILDAVPTRAQLAVGAYDMLRFWITPVAADYYADMGIDFRFHQMLRFLDEPASLTDPIGLLSTPDAIIGHLLQVVHASATYDMQLLEMFDGGLDELERQALAMLDGSHPRAASIGAIVEEPDYHCRLLGFVAEHRARPGGATLLRSNVAAKPELRELERTFGAMTTSFRYFCRLPPDWPGALRHALRVRRFPHALAEP